jgi:hypothetical protein
MRYLLIPAIAASLFATVAQGETMRCGSSLVSESSTVEQLLGKCGEPASRRSTTQDSYSRNPDGSTRKVGAVTTEYWTYDRGSQAAPFLVTIVEGKIKSIARVR